MKILVFNGSPKGDKSDTMHITRAFLSGIKEASVNTINVINKNIKYCTGCFSCMRNGGTCVLDDDMKEILPEILASDVLLFNFPLYCYGMPAPLKALVDRILPLSSMKMKKVGDRYRHLEQADTSKLRYIMICGCGFPNSVNNFEGAITQFKLMFGNDSTILTVPEAPMFGVLEAEQVTKPYLEIVRQAGCEYGESGIISEETRKKLDIPMIPDELYAKICNGEITP